MLARRNSTSSADSAGTGVMTGTTAAHLPPPSSSTYNSTSATNAFGTDFSSNINGSSSRPVVVPPPNKWKDPKTVLDKIIYAIRLQPGNPSFVSRQVIMKFLKNEMGYDNAVAFRRALKKGIDKGVLNQNHGQSFQVNEDPIYHYDNTGKSSGNNYPNLNHDTTVQESTLASSSLSHHQHGIAPAPPSVSAHHSSALTAPAPPPLYPSLQPPTAPVFTTTTTTTPEVMYPPSDSFLLEKTNSTGMAGGYGGHTPFSSVPIGYHTNYAETMTSGPPSLVTMSSEDNNNGFYSSANAFYGHDNMALKENCP